MMWLMMRGRGKSQRPGDAEIADCALRVDLSSRRPAPVRQRADTAEAAVMDIGFAAGILAAAVLATYFSACARRRCHCAANPDADGT